jgi:hypothetical protein
MQSEATVAIVRLTAEQHEAACGQLMVFVTRLLSRQTGEYRPFPDNDEDDPLIWDLGTYPKTVELLRDLVDEHC